MCPFFQGEIENHKKRIGIKCDAVEIRFLSNEVRREWVYPLCGSVEGYEDCPIYKALVKTLADSERKQ
jgi:hypothetical protein